MRGATRVDGNFGVPHLSNRNLCPIEFARSQKEMQQIVLSTAATLESSEFLNAGFSGTTTKIQSASKSGIVTTSDTLRWRVDQRQ